MVFVFISFQTRQQNFLKKLFKSIIALKNQENISTADICSELFEGDNIVVGKSDNGQSQLVSGPFANKAK